MRYKDREKFISKKLEITVNGEREKWEYVKYIKRETLLLIEYKLKKRL